MSNPKLSIIVPMREGVSRSWLDQLLEVKGNVAFILVYPPGVPFLPSADGRLTQIMCPIRGELIQRVTALLNATGEYVLSINCDEYLHHDILTITEDYFSRFPESYFFRLKQASFPYGELPLSKPWEALSKLDDMVAVARKTSHPDINEEYLLKEIPIAPLTNSLDLRAAFRGRRDHKGPHQENFDKKVWKNTLVQETLKKVVGTFNLCGPIKYIPFWTADRLLGLGVQSHFFEPDKIVGHWLPSPEQLRTEDNPPDQPRKNRRYALAELSLLKIFPTSGYLWNLILFNHGGILMVWFPRDTFKQLISRFKLPHKSIFRATSRKV